MSEIAYQAKGKWLDILARLGIPDEHLSGKNGPCPFCGGTDRFRFTDTDRGGEHVGAYICSPHGNGCGAGDGFDFLMKYHGWDFKKTAQEVESVIGICKAVEQKPANDPAIRLNKIRANAKRLTGKDPASIYLHNRGIGAAPGLKFSESEPYFDQGVLIGHYPAMLGLVQSPQGKPLTWHVTYLLDGKKAPVGSPKKVMKAVGGINGAAIRLFPVKDKMGIAEGIETAIAAFQITGIPTWAVLNTTGMQSFILPDSVKEITVFGDNDANYAGQLAAYSIANRLSLKGTSVNVWIPEGTGQDWLDVLAAEPRRYAGHRGMGE